MFLHDAAGYISLAVAGLRKVCLPVCCVLTASLEPISYECKLDMTPHVTITAKRLPKQPVNVYVCEVVKKKLNTLVLVSEAVFFCSCAKTNVDNVMQCDIF